MANQYKDKPYCIRGHAFTTENTYLTKKGGRMCRQCHLERGRKAQGYQGIVKLPLAERFWAQVNKAQGQGPDGTCWVWTGFIGPHGYGQCTPVVPNVSRISHRNAYVLINGSIPKGMIIMHSCDNRACVNPDHLRAGTQLENMLDMHEKGRATSGHSKKTHCPQGHEYDAANTIIVHANGGARRVCRTCSRQRSREWAAKQRAIGVKRIRTAQTG